MRRPPRKPRCFMTRPRACTGLVERLGSSFSRIVSLPWVSWLAMRLATVIDRPLMRISNGRVRLSFIIPCVLVECRGARSGELREVPLLCVPDGDDLLVIGSNGGAPREPAWCANLRAQPAIRTQFEGRAESRTALELAGAEAGAAPGILRWRYIRAMSAIRPSFAPDSRVSAWRDRRTPTISRSRRAPCAMCRRAPFRARSTASRRRLRAPLRLCPWRQRSARR